MSAARGASDPSSPHWSPLGRRTPTTWGAGMSFAPDIAFA
jgi:hypothetical protein